MCLCVHSLLLSALIWDWAKKKNIEENNTHVPSGIWVDNKIEFYPMCRRYGPDCCANTWNTSLLSPITNHQCDNRHGTIKNLLVDLNATKSKKIGEKNKRNKNKKRMRLVVRGGRRDWRSAADSLNLFRWFSANLLVSVCVLLLFFVYFISSLILAHSRHCVKFSISHSYVLVWCFTYNCRMFTTTE